MSRAIAFAAFIVRARNSVGSLGGMPAIEAVRRVNVVVVGYRLKGSCAIEVHHAHPMADSRCTAEPLGK